MAYLIDTIRSTINDIYTNGLKMEHLPTDSLSTNCIPVVTAFIGKDPVSPMYGRIIGFFEYSNKLYRFTFHVHTPNQKSPRLSNKMTTLNEVIISNKWGITAPDYADTNFGKMAFWLYTDLAYLKKEDENAYELRRLMISITDYSREQNFCKYFRKMDKAALTQNPIYK